MKRIVLFSLFAIAGSLFGIFSAQAQSSDGISLRYSLNSSYYLVERSNWSKYENGKYVGLTHRETRANVGAVPGGSGNLRFSGFFYVLEETLRDMSRASRGLDETREAAFTVSPEGKMAFQKDPGFPALREFPVYPQGPVYPGDRWQAEGKRVIDPKNDGKRTILPIMVEYEFIGPEAWNGRSVHRLKAKFATRINKYLKTKSDDPALKDATGTHDVDILVDAETGTACLILDRLDETFIYEDGSSIRFRGNTAIFTEAPVPIDGATLIPKIAGISERSATVDRSNQSPRTGGTPLPPTDDTFAESAGNVAQGTKAPATGMYRAPEASPPPSPDVPAQIGTPLSPPPANGASGEGKKPFSVEETPQGIRLSVRDIRFAADSDAILGEEAWRLDAIADALKLVPGGRFLVEGHTASVGKPEGEKRLSVARAQRIVEELTKRGLQPEQFIYAGYGGTKPVADNATGAGRAQNRRVEITILE
jgi:outer membrane protein OmpA-like peptidoglycan-associated protein